jgi:hypothetical protein
MEYAAMVSWLCARRSAITFDVGAAGLRAYQLRRRGRDVALCDTLEFERPPGHGAEPPAAPVVDPDPLARLIEQGRFVGPEVALVLSPPEVQFLPIRLPAQALAQPPERIEQALKWEVAQESRDSSAGLEVRHWPLPVASRQSAAADNVMAVVAPGELVRQWCDVLDRQGLTLRRIDVSPCALVRLACCAWTPAADDLWGVLDLGLRHSTLTVVIGRVPTYIRTLSGSAHQWTQTLAEAFEVPYDTAERLKREQSVEPTDRGVRVAAESGNLLQAADLRGAFSGVLRESLRALAHEVGRCFSYVMHGFPDTSIKRMFLAGGGAGLSGLATVLEAELGLPVSALATRRQTASAAWEHPLRGITLLPQAATALGGAILDLESP